MSEKVLGIVAIQRTIFGFARSRRIAYEMLFFTPDRVIVAQAGDDPFLLGRWNDAIETYIEPNKTKELKLPLEHLLIGKSLIKS